jgi:hypothetical protein
MPMTGHTSYKQPQQGDRAGGRNNGGSPAANPGAANNSGSQAVAEGAAPGGSGRAAGRGPAQDSPPKQGLTIHRAGAGGGPARTRASSGIEARSNTPAHEAFDDEVCAPMLY